MGYKKSLTKVVRHPITKEIGREVGQAVVRVIASHVLGRK